MIQGPISSMKNPNEKPEISEHPREFDKDPEIRALANKFLESYNAACEPLISAVKSAKENNGPDHPSVYEALEKLSKHYKNFADFGEQIPVLLEMLDFAERVYGKEHEKVYDVLLDLAKSARGQRDYIKQIECLLRLLDHTVDRNGEGSLAKYAWMTASAGIAYGKLNMIEEKAEFLLMAVKIYIKAPDSVILEAFSDKEDIREIADHCYARGLQGLQQKQFFAAIRLFSKAHSLYKLLLAPNDKLIAQASYRLACACAQEKLYPDALKYFKEALPILKDAGNHEMVANCEQNIADISKMIDLQNKHRTLKNDPCVSCNML